MARERIPIALTIAGSDSGGGAGVQADLHTFAAHAVHGVAAITTLTAQNPKGVRAVEAASPAMVRAQIEAVFDELPPRAVKTGMLYSKAIIETVCAVFPCEGVPQLVVDPVMVATSGARLLERSAERRLMDGLFPLATLVTPNVDEAEVITGLKIRDAEGLRAAARWIQSRFGCAALVKGGHLAGVREAMDLFYDGREELLLSAPFVKGVATHGTGCTYSAAITANLALGRKLPEAVRRAKEYITGAISASRLVAGHQTLNWFWSFKKARS